MVFNTKKYKAFLLHLHGGMQGRNGLLQAVGTAGTSVGLDGITVQVVPEPSSMLAIASVAGLFMMRRRR